MTSSNDMVMLAGFVLFALLILGRFGSSWRRFDRAKAVHHRFRVELLAKGWALAHAIAATFVLTSGFASERLHPSLHVMYGTFLIAMPIIVLIAGLLLSSKEEDLSESLVIAQKAQKVYHRR